MRDVYRKLIQVAAIGAVGTALTIEIIREIEVQKYLKEHNIELRRNYDR